MLATAPAQSPTTFLALTSSASLLCTDRTLQAMEAFWTIYLPTEKQGQDGSIGGLLSAPWVPVVREIAEAEHYVKKALEACAYAGLGWIKDDHSLVRYGMQPYVYALRGVNKALQDPRQATSDTVLAACRVLSLFEMLRKLPASGREEVQATSWQTHAAGAYQLLRFRGRVRHTSSHGLHLYDGVRLMGVVQGLSQRQANTFTKLCWNLPQRDLRDELFDLMSSVPELFEASDQLLAECSCHTVQVTRELLMQRGNDLLQRYLVVAHALTAWESRALSLCQPDVPQDGSLSLAAHITLSMDAFNLFGQ
ncbi:hypothetical protein AMS68_004064 [Peltaster fructicola]|uniref:Uncharacterized protein n=1 Tax=Peltaster fructicola TaxID=286661 RepID=A0A6H0XUW2_9PEZI|nr:hypothetical protein AMS68_004064 [Peltaster fructicola]